MSTVLPVLVVQVQGTCANKLTNVVSQDEFVGRSVIQLK